VISIVIETFNLGDDLSPLHRLLARLAPQRGGADIVITHTGIPAAQRTANITWLELPATAGYYEHKNHGVAAARGEVIAFIDADCEPAPGWLAALTQPIAQGDALVVAGRTTYPGPLAPLANELDFPQFADRRRAGTVRNFFANNVAFARAAFVRGGGYPTVAGMFHGQCQLLALELASANIAIQLARDARVTHAWPTSARAWLEVRLLRGADTATLLPFVIAHFAPMAGPLAHRMKRGSALAVIAARAVRGSVAALRTGPRVRGLALLAAVTLVDAIGCAAAPAVYRAYGIA
jgi:hypothetical protein